VKRGGGRRVSGHRRKGRDIESLRRVPKEERKQGAGREKTKVREADRTSGVGSYISGIRNRRDSCP